MSTAWQVLMNVVLKLVQNSALFDQYIGEHDLYPRYEHIGVVGPLVKTSLDKAFDEVVL